MIIIESVNKTWRLDDDALHDDYLFILYRMPNYRPQMQVFFSIGQTTLIARRKVLRQPMAAAWDTEGELVDLQ